MVCSRVSAEAMVEVGNSYDKETQSEVRNVKYPPSVRQQAHSRESQASCRDAIYDLKKMRLGRYLCRVLNLSLILNFRNP